MASSKQLFCGICEGRNIYLEAIQYCPECEDAFCNTCLEHHSIAKATKTHNLILAENYKNLPSFILDIKTFCNEHNEKYQNYCIHHEHPLCKKCISTTHKTCKDIATLDDVIRHIKSSTSIENVEISLEDATQNIQNITADRGNNLKTLKQQRQDINEEVNNVFDKLNRHLNGLQKDVLSRLNDEAEKHENCLESFLHDLKEREIKIEHLRDSICKMKTYASDLQAFLGMRRVEELVQQEEKYIDDILAKDFLKRVSLLYSPNNEVKDIVSRISTFGQVSSEKKPSTITLVKRSDQQAQIAKHQRPLDIPEEEHKEKIYRALYSHQADDEEELTFSEGDILQITDDSDSNWWKGRKVDFKNNTDFHGWIPSNYLKKENALYSYAWYVGQASKYEREKMMSRRDATTGLFFIAESSVPHSTYIYELSVLHLYEQNPLVYHYKMTQTDTGFDISDKNTSIRIDAKSLPELVAHLSRDACGLCQKLIKPCQQEKEDWEVSEGSLNLKVKLHDGEHGIVWKGRWNKAVPVAVAEVKLRECFLTEIGILKQCRHKNIVKMYGVCSPSRYIVTELMSKGNLLEFLRGEDSKVLKFPDLVRTAAQIADGMTYLELNSILHKDLKANNILMTENHEAKISGFHLSLIMKTEVHDVKHGEKFPIKWTAPEAAIYGKFSVKSDVWSYGIVLVELFTCGQIPYPGMQYREVLEQIERGYRMSKPSKCPDWMYDIMKKCWNKDPASRPTFDFLFSVLDDYCVSTEPEYEGIDD